MPLITGTEQLRQCGLEALSAPSVGLSLAPPTPCMDGSPPACPSSQCCLELTKLRGFPLIPDQVALPLSLLTSLREDGGPQARRPWTLLVSPEQELRSFLSVFSQFPLPPKGGFLTTVSSLMLIFCGVNSLTTSYHRSPEGPPTD